MKENTNKLELTLKKGIKYYNSDTIVEVEKTSKK